jgi:type IV pilus assembly protein PilE
MKTNTFKTMAKFKTLARKSSGFTIVELMIVIMIVAILVSLAYPSYVGYVRKAKRGEAQQLLLNWAINQEIWRSNNTQYTNTLAPTHDDYTFEASNVGAASYTLTATAAVGNDQERDKARNGTSCSALTLTQAGAKTEPVCWD